MMPCPHDLLWVAPDAVRFDGGCPEWADEAWLLVAPVVVRREATADGVVPVGLRGLARNQRCKGYVALSAVTRCVTPEMLAATVVPAVPCPARESGAAPHSAARAAPEIVAPADGLVALAALHALARALDALGLAWGPGGGVGFHLATGLPVLRPDSDLDLLVRAPQPLSAEQAAALEDIQLRSVCRVDIQIDTGSGAFALAEWTRASGGAGGSKRVMLKTATGPLLCADPWQPGPAP